MKLMPHPSAKRYVEYSKKVETDGFRKGAYACAIDVWIDHVHVFRSWDGRHGEPMLDWAGRNYPQFSVPPFAESPFGCQKQVHNLDETLVPTRAALDRALSLSEITLIMSATLAIARQSEDGSHRNLPSPNTIRQRIHQKAEDWGVFDMHDHGIHVRTLIAQYEPPAEPLAEFRISVEASDHHPVEAGVWRVQAPPVGTFKDGKARRAAVRAAFQAAGIGPLRLTPSVIEQDRITFHCPMLDRVEIVQERVLEVERAQGFFDLGVSR